MAGVELVLRPPAEVKQQRGGLEDVKEALGGCVPEHHEAGAVADHDLFKLVHGIWVLGLGMEQVLTMLCLFIFHDTTDLVSFQGVRDHCHHLARVLLVILGDIGEKLVLVKMVRDDQW